MDWLSPSASVNKVKSANKPFCDSEAHLLLPTNTWRYMHNIKTLNEVVKDISLISLGRKCAEKTH